MDYLLLVAALVGHTSLWVAAINRLHSLGLPYHLVKRAGHAGFAFLGLIALGFGAWLMLVHPAIGDVSGGRLHLLLHPLHQTIPWPGLAYLGLCWMSAAVSVLVWGCRRAFRRPPAVVRYDRARRITPAAAGRSAVSADSAGRDARPTPSSAPESNGHHFLLRVPGNETLDLDLSERALEIARLPHPLDGLTVAHLSDLHFTGRVAKAYFQEAVRQSNRFQPDLVAVTGDLLDHSRYIDWLPDTLGKLESRHGVYFVLGNHDTKVDAQRVRRTLTGLGLVDLGGRWVEIRVRGEPIVLAGSELPWFSPAADLAGAPGESAGGRALRIALAHSPDQFRWARANDVDLLLVGHTHGGQIRLPLVGPILTPSRTGVKYACGVFHAPPTVMHVTRGVSAEHPIRLNCPPEVVRLVLRAEGRGGDGACQPP